MPLVAQEDSDMEDEDEDDTTQGQRIYTEIFLLALRIQSRSKTRKFAEIA